jgi:hypothetical protein
MPNSPCPAFREKLRARANLFSCAAVELNPDVGHKGKKPFVSHMKSASKPANTVKRTQSRTKLECIVCGGVPPIPPRAKGVRYCMVAEQTTFVCFRQKGREETDMSMVVGCPGCVSDPNNMRVPVDIMLCIVCGGPGAKFAAVHHGLFRMAQVAMVCCSADCLVVYMNDPVVSLPVMDPICCVFASGRSGPGSASE